MASRKSRSQRVREDSTLWPPYEVLPSHFGVNDRYRRCRPLGGGSFGEVILVWDSELEIQVALKRLKAGIEWFERDHELFRKEYSILKTLRGHENIVAVHEIGRDRGVPFITMEYLPGEDLIAHGYASLPDLVGLVSQVFLAIHSFHSRGIVHRDLKPSNTMVVYVPGKDGAPDRDVVKLLDFGFAMRERRGADQLVGTPEFIAPEVFRSGGDPSTYDGRLADLYAAGVIMYILLTGHFPSGRKYPGGSRSHEEVEEAFRRGTEVPPINSFRQTVPNVPTALDAIVMSLLHDDPQERPQSAKAVLDQLQAQVDASVVTARGHSLAHEQNPYCDATGVLRKLRWMLDDRKSGVVVLRAPCGFGRSRLLEEAGTEFSQREAVEVVSGAYTESGDLEVIPHTGTQSLASFLESVAVEGGTLDPQDPGGQLDGELEDALARRLETRSVVILIDDAQWADATSLAALHQATLRLIEKARIPVTASLLLVLSVDAGAPGGVLDVVSSRRQPLLLDLGAFDRDQIAQYLQGVGEWDEVEAEELVSLLEDRTGGVPAAMDKLLRRLEKEEVIKAGRHRWKVSTQQLARFRGDAPGGERWGHVTEGLQGDHMTVLTALACFGTSTPARDLIPVCQLPGEAIQRALDYLILNKGLVRRSGDAYRITQGSIRSQIYASMAEPARAEMHRRIAVMLEQSYGNQLEKIYDQLSRHWVAGGGGEAGAHYGILAARRFMEFPHRYQRAFARAIPCFTDAIRVHDARPDAGSQRLVFDLRMDLARAYLATRQADAAADVLAAARATAARLGEPLPLARCAIVEAEQRIARWQHERVGADEARHGLVQTKELLEQQITAIDGIASADAEVLRADLLEQLATVLERNRDHLEAVRHLEASLAIYRKLSRPRRSRVLSKLAFSCLKVGAWDQARAACEEAIQVATAEDDRVGLSDAHREYAFFFQNLGQPKKAFKQYEEARRHAMAAHHDGRAVAISVRHAELLVLMALASKAERVAQDVLDTYGAGVTGTLRIQAQAALGRSLVLQGRYEQAEKELEESTRLAKFQDNARWQWQPQVWLARSRYERGLPEEGHALLRSVLAEEADRRKAGSPTLHRFDVADCLMLEASWRAREGWVALLERDVAATELAAADIERLCEEVLAHHPDHLHKDALLGCARGMRGETDTIQGYERTMADARETGWDSFVAEVAYHYGLAALCGGLYEDAERILYEAVDALKEIQMVDLQIRSAALLMYAFMGQKRWEPAAKWSRFFDDRVAVVRHHMPSHEMQARYLKEPFRARVDRDGERLNAARRRNTA